MALITAEFIKRLRARINQGDSWLSYDLAHLARGGEIDKDLVEELESQLVMADVGIETTERIIDGLQRAWRAANEKMLQRFVMDCEILCYQYSSPWPSLSKSLHLSGPLSC